MQQTTAEVDSDTEFDDTVESEVDLEIDTDKNEKNAKGENSKGDSSPAGHPHSDSSKAKISAANKGKVPWNVGKKHSEETRLRIAEKTKEAMLKRRVQKALELGFESLEAHEEQKKKDKILLKIEKDKTKVKGLTNEGRKKISDRQ